MKTEKSQEGIDNRMLEKFYVSMMNTNCYLYYDEDSKEAMVIDIGDTSEQLLEFIKENELKVKYIYLTHCHFDHISGAEWLKENVGGEIVILEAEKENLKDINVNLSEIVSGKSVSFEPDKVVFEGDELLIGNDTFKVIYTPGHTAGGSCLYNGDILFAGDTLFLGTHGRTDLPTSNYSDIIRAIKTKLLTLPDDTIVYPGHGGSTTIGAERELY